MNRTPAQSSSLMRRLGFLVFVLACLFLCVAPAEAQRENRFLIVIDTSSSMRARSNSVVQAVNELLKSNMKGEFRRGDSLGVWSYNERLYYDFPMQIWWETNRETIQANVLNYLRSQRFEKKARFERVFPTVQEVMAQSRRLTTIFIFDGSAKITGTPYNDDINELHTSFYRELKKAQVPFVTTLASRNGIVVDYTVSSPGSIKLPHLADPYPPPVTNAVAKVITNSPATNIVAAPPPPRKYTEIVMSGTAVKTNPPTPPPAVALTTNVVASAEKSETNITMTATPPSPAPQSVTVVTTAVTTLSVQPSNPPAKPPAVAFTPVPEKVAMAPTPLPPSPEPARKFSNEEVIATTPTNNVAVSPVENKPPPPSAPVAATSSPTEIALFVIAFALLIIAFALVWFLVRRARSGSSGSLISQSLDRSR